MPLGSRAWPPAPGAEHRSRGSISTGDVRLPRRSFSGNHGAYSARAGPEDAAAGSSRGARTHHRTMSAASLVPEPPSADAAAPPWPGRRPGRLATVLRTGLRRAPSTRERPLPGTRARAATGISTDYVSVSVADRPATAVPPAASAVCPASAVCSGGIGLGIGSPAADLCISHMQGAFRPRKRSLSVGGEGDCHAFFVRQVEQYGLQPLLTSPVATCYFLASAISSYTPETLLFYLEAEHYRSASFSDGERRTRYAKGLYKAFVSHRAPLEINISHTMRQRITSAFRAGGPAPLTLFQETQAHAHALLEQDFVQFRQRPLFRRMMADLASLRRDPRLLSLRAVAAVYDALASTYGIRALPAGKPRLVQAEAPLFVKFADMDLTSTDLGVALPAWLCRTSIRLLDTPMPSSHEELSHMLRLATRCVPAATVAVRAPPSQPPSGSAVVALLPPLPPPPPPPATSEPPAPAEGPAKKAVKQKSLQRLRLLLHPDPEPRKAAHSENEGRAEPPPPSTVRSRWDALWGSRRRRP
ncbi:hypothetical protein H4R18_003135 [Coemansia javaensis]|uniref:RGS domain-containing protein n=1 Tax=Coemansia javaensis TaxID=2761396 RepID=A0A9W8LGR9_9FUNG|nr:hypothetical protein H4R18_003135 [Coemansia javaensis]